MPTAFFDTSGFHKNQEVIVFGGVCSSDKDFNLGFARDWKRALVANGLKVLTMKKALNPKKPLSAARPALGVRNRVRALLPFVLCIRKHLQLVTGVAIHVPAYSASPEVFRKAFTDDPVYLAFLRSILKILDHTTKGSMISLVCDDDESCAMGMYRLYQKARKLQRRARHTLRMISFGDDDVFYGLQAADMVASIFRKEAMRRFFNESHDYDRLFKALTRKRRAGEKIHECSIAFVDENAMARTAKRLIRTFRRA